MALVQSLNFSSLEARSDVLEASDVLKELKLRGLGDPVISGGWIRALLTGTEPKDIDVIYVGNVHYERAQFMLAETLKFRRIDPAKWDIEGIWNATAAWGFDRIEGALLTFYITSVDCCYLGADGALHDPTSYGFEDALSGTLRFTDFEDPLNPHTSDYLVHMAVEGCARIAKYGWKPTERSAYLLRRWSALWDELTDEERRRKRVRLLTKSAPADTEAIRKVCTEYGCEVFIDGA